MLSFLREQSPDDSLVQKPAEAGDKKAADTTRQTQEQEYLTVATQGNKFARPRYCLLFCLV